MVRAPGPAYVCVHALLLSVLSFVATNLGGFLVGTLLGSAGSALPDGAADEEGADAQAPCAPGVARAGTGRTGRARAAPSSDARRRAPAAAGRRADGVGPARQGGGSGLRAAGGRTPPTVTTSLFAPQGFAFAGVTEVATADGPLRVLVLKVRAASLEDYRLRTRDGREEYGLAARSLELRGDVTLYLPKFSGCIDGLLCLTFSPDGLPAPR